ncbi:MAG: hypothetical protein ACLRQF_07255 [Thomasclavelia ramosa]
MVRQYNDSKKVALVANDSTITTKVDLRVKNIGAQLALLVKCS